MITMTVDRCYDRYLINMNLPPRNPSPTLTPGQAAGLAAELLSQVLCSTLSGYLEAGRLREYRCGEEDGALTLDVEPSSGNEEYLAAAIDTVAEGMCLLSERYPEEIQVEI